MRTIGLSLVVAATILSACDKQTVHQTSAVVVDIAHGLRPKWDTDKVRITARSSKGLIAEKSIPLAQLKCHVGDTVRAWVQGVALILDDRACVSQWPLSDHPAGKQNDRNAPKPDRPPPIR